VITEAGAHRLADLANRKGESGLLEGWHHDPFVDDPQIATLRGAAGIFRLGFRQFLKRLTGNQTLANAVISAST
jgi:hypothetical protein